jgi:hypothetical protein
MPVRRPRPTNAGVCSLILREIDTIPLNIDNNAGLETERQDAAANMVLCVDACAGSITFTTTAYLNPSIDDTFITLYVNNDLAFSPMRFSLH